MIVAFLTNITWLPQDVAKRVAQGDVDPITKIPFQVILLAYIWQNVCTFWHFNFASLYISPLKQFVSFVKISSLFFTICLHIYVYNSYVSMRTEY